MLTQSIHPSIEGWSFEIWHYHLALEFALQMEGLMMPKSKKQTSKQTKTKNQAKQKYQNYPVILIW